MEALVVDDSLTVRVALRAHLNALGCKVLLAENGLEALRLLEGGSQVDVCLVDWNMPVMDGLQLLRELQARKHPAADKVMMVTSEAELSQIEKALDAGAKEYLMKPVSPEALVEKLALMGWDLGTDGGDTGRNG